MPKKEPPAPEKKSIAENDPRRQRWIAITELAVRECGSLDQARAWLNSPKVALGGKTPLEAMTTAKGCDAVEKLLRQLNT